VREGGNLSEQSESENIELIHGMRGAIPATRMQEIQSTLPYSMELRHLNPRLTNPLGGLSSKHAKIRAFVRLSQGWHMLNEARSALVEAAACKVFYEDCEPNPIEAIYRCRFYLDDAALRLYSSCEHLLKCVGFYWSLRQHSSLDRVIAEAEKSASPEVSGEVAAILRGLTKDWEECMKYRNYWVHNERPSVAGLDWEVSFRSGNAESEIPPQILKAMGSPTKVSAVTVGTKIDELYLVVKNAYCQLFDVYRRFAPLVK
jgi:hypothetical protein